MSNTTRLDIERNLLAEHWPNFHIQDPYGQRAGVIGKMHSNSFTDYAIWLSMRHFPNEAPGAYILQPKPLKNYNGVLLASLGGTASMHLLAADSHGHPQICHYNDKFWNPNISLYKILMKVRIWLDAYEQHLKYGKPVDNYLGHM